jgi:cell division transport system ATP-binding protein
VLAVTHERELVNHFTKRVIAIDAGKIVSDRTGGYFTYDGIN